MSPAAVGGIVLTAGAGLALAVQIHLLYRHKPQPNIAVARTRAEAAAEIGDPSPYPSDVFPGGRDAATPYGTIRVYEWGPVTGEKILLMHGIGTPCIALKDMAEAFVERGCRVMLYDYFGRGYSDAPTDLPYDDRLYTTQVLLVLASSPLSWTGDAAFHVVGYSLGGALAASLAAYFPRMLRSVNLVCPGGLIRSASHVGLRSRILYSEGLLPVWLSRRLVRGRLEPRHGGSSADVPVDDLDLVDLSMDEEEEEEKAGVDFDSVPIFSKDGSVARVGDVMAWQLRSNPGLVGAYMSTIRHAPVYDQHDGLWQRLRKVLEERRPADASCSGPDGSLPPGLPRGKVTLFLATRDPVVVKDEWIEDARAVLGPDGVDIHIIPGGHEIAITKGVEIADRIMETWKPKARN